MKIIAIAAALGSVMAAASAMADGYPGVDPRVVKSYAQCMLDWDADQVGYARDLPAPDYAAIERISNMATAYADDRLVLCMEAKGAIRKEFCAQNNNARNRNCYQMME